MRRIGVLALFPLAACVAAPASIPVEIRPAIPSALLVCAAEPPPPQGDPLMESVYAHWVLALRAAGDECRGKLGAVKALLETP